METLESTARARRRRMMIGEVIIGTLSLAATVGLVVAAPNAVQLLKYLDLGSSGSRDPRLRVSEAVSRLRRKGIVEWKHEGGSWRLRLTDKGKAQAVRLQRGAIRIPQPKRWDGRWRFVMFDIPERQHTLRRRVRQIIAKLGFHQFQESVWVYPYDCEEIVAMLKVELGTGNKLLYVVADAVEYDLPLRRHFKLSR
jgi:DNA-binding transcriptional regulator PaaX